MDETRKPLTPAQKMDNLLSKLKRRAEEIGFGRMTIDVVIHNGQITQLELTRATEIIRGD